MDSVKTQISLRIHEVGLVPLSSTYINEVLLKINFDITTEVRFQRQLLITTITITATTTTTTTTTTTSITTSTTTTAFCCCYYYYCNCRWLCLLLLLLLLLLIIIIIITLKYMKPIKVICKKEAKMLINLRIRQSDQSSLCTHSVDFAVSWPIGLVTVVL